MKLNKNLFHIYLSLLLIVMPIVNAVSQVPLILPQLKQRSIIIPLQGFDNTFVKVRIIETGEQNSNTLFGMWLSFRFYGQSLIAYGESPYVTLPLIPYDSIKESKFYLPNENKIFQRQIKSNCNNFYPVPSGLKNYFYYIVDERRKFDLDYHSKYDVWGDFNIPANKSLYIEIDINRREHKTTIIDTPSDIFVDMCK